MADGHTSMHLEMDAFARPPSDGSEAKPFCELCFKNDARESALSEYALTLTGS